MLSKANRLGNKKDIERVFKKGKGFKEDFLILKIVKNNLDRTRFTFIVSKKISTKASLRNKIRRKLSELVRIKLKMIKKGTDNIIIASPGLEKKDFWEIEEIINQLFRKAKILKLNLNE